MIRNEGFAPVGGWDHSKCKSLCGWKCFVSLIKEIFRILFFIPCSSDHSSGGTSVVTSDEESRRDCSYSSPASSLAFSPGGSTLVRDESGGAERRGSSYEKGASSPTANPQRVCSTSPREEDSERASDVFGKVDGGPLRFFQRKPENNTCYVDANLWALAFTEYIFPLIGIHKEGETWVQDLSQCSLTGAHRDIAEMLGLVLCDVKNFEGDVLERFGGPSYQELLSKMNSLLSEGQRISIGQEHFDSDFLEYLLAALQVDQCDCRHQLRLHEMKLDSLFQSLVEEGKATLVKGIDLSSLNECFSVEMPLRERDRTRNSQEKKGLFNSGESIISSIRLQKTVKLFDSHGNEEEFDVLGATVDTSSHYVFLCSENEEVWIYNALREKVMTPQDLCQDETDSWQVSQLFLKKHSPK